MKYFNRALFLLTCLLLPFQAEAQSGNALQYIYARAAMGDVSSLRSWVARGGNLNIQDAQGDTPYCMAVRLQNQTAVRSLESAGADTNPRCMKRFSLVTESMIYSAADDGDTKQLSLWQRYGVSPDVMDEDGNTALCEAVMKHNCPAIDILLKAGANQYHSCLNRIPMEVRRTLDCKEVVRDWSKFGLTILGGGAIAGVAIALANGGGSDSQSCGEYERWNGTECVACSQDQYWDKGSLICKNCPANQFALPGALTCTTCSEQDTFFNRETGVCEECPENSFSEGNVDACETCGTQATWNSSERRCECGTGLCLDQTTKNCRAPRGAKYTDDSIQQGEYIDPETGYCKPISPSPFDSTTYQTELAKYTSGSYKTEYKESGVLADIKAANAYARGYTGYVVNREYDEDTGYNEFGPLADGDPITSEQVPVAVLSSGMVTNDNGIQPNAPSGAVYVEGKADEAYYLNPDFQDSDGNLINIGEEYNFDPGKCNGENQKNCYKSKEFTGAELAVYVDKKGDSYAIDATTLELVSWDEVTSGTYQNYLSADDNNLYKYLYEQYSVTGNINDATPHYLISTTDSDPEALFHTGVNKYWKFPQVGTQLAALIAASQNGEGILGVAFNAQVIPTVANILHPLADVNHDTTSSKGDVITTLTNEGVNIILQDYIRYPTTIGSGMINLASSVKGNPLDEYYYSAAVKAYNALADSDAVLVVPTGTYQDNVDYNSSGQVNSLEIDDAGIDAGAPLSSDWRDDDLLGHFVSVTAVEYDTAHKLYHLMSNALPCGSTGNYCLSAPGNAVATISPTESGKYVTSEVSGTQAAAAVVAGSIAILKGAYPHLTTSEVVEILYRTATPLGAAAGTTSSLDSKKTGTYGTYSTLYGYGLVNLEAATRPVGPLWVNNGFSTGTSGNIQYMPYASQTKVTASKAVSSALLTALPQTMTVYDSYNREFSVSLENAFSSRSAERHDFEDDFHAFLQGRDTTTLTPNERFSMTYAPRYSSRSSVVPNGLMEMQLNTGKLQTKLFYAEDTQTRGHYFERVLNNPLVQIQEAYGFSSAYQLNNQWQVGASYTAGKNGFFGDGDKDFDAPDNKISAFSVDVAYRPIKSVAFKATYGLMEEDDSVLGMIGEGNFALNGASTAFVGAGVSLRPTNKLKVDLMYTYGWTSPKSTDGLMRLSKMTSDGFALTAQYQPDEKQLFGFSLSSPLQVRSGKVSVALPTGRSSSSDTYYSQVYTSSLKPSARELAFALFYKDKVSEDLTIQSEVGVRLNPDHQSDVKTDYRGMLGIKYRY